LPAKQNCKDSITAFFSLEIDLNSCPEQSLIQRRENVGLILLVHII